EVVVVDASGPALVVPEEVDVTIDQPVPERLGADGEGRAVGPDRRAGLLEGLGGDGGQQEVVGGGQTGEGPGGAGQVVVPGDGSVSRGVLPGRGSGGILGGLVRRSRGALIL